MEIPMRLYFKSDLCENIFGWECFKKRYPNILIEGVPVKLIKGLYYVTKDNIIVHDSQFFTEKEVKDYCIVKEEDTDVY